jgi:hypothetical protein
MKVFKRKKFEPEITRAEALNSKPVKSIQINESRLESGEVLLAYPVTIRPWLATLIHRLGGPSETIRTKKLQLDMLGASVWNLLDDRRSVNEIIQQFARTHRIHPKEAEAAVTRFLRDLGRRGLIGFQ